MISHYLFEKGSACLDI